MMNICLIEDEENIVDLIRLNLELEGFKVRSFQNGMKAKEMINEVIQHDLIILDVMLPEYSGFDLCKDIRALSDTPILFLSAKGIATDRIHGLKLGANDYLAKPFDLEELILRIRNLVSTKTDQKIKNIQIGEVKVNFSSYEAHNNGEIIHVFSKREIELLELFNENEGKVVSRDLILDKLWGKDHFPTSRTIDNYILTFRKIFESNPKNPIFFHSVRGVGYRFTN
ncbi:MAG: DNA-binding response regulator [Flavobacteriales bacterium]|nr:MAG: DNA-binding response regulator [Flavobacteriales bacterium]